MDREELLPKENDRADKANTVDSILLFEVVEYHLAVVILTTKISHALKEQVQKVFIDDTCIFFATNILNLRVNISQYIRVVQ